MKTELYRKLYSKFSRKVLKTKLIRHKEPSLIFSPGNIPANEFLIDLITRALALAWNDPILSVNKNLSDSQFLNIFPGEHYRILKAFTKVLHPKVVVEVGTYTGMGSVAISEGLDDGILYTYDIIKWDKLQTHLTDENFKDKKIIQILSDLSNPEEYAKNIYILNQADLIFIDAPKDGVFEYKLLSLLTKLDKKDKKLIILDDIKFVNMIDLWVSIASPKLDISSFGHWSGTGIVDISNGLELIRD